jgi:acyl-CoA thioester hydrolase
MTLKSSSLRVALKPRPYEVDFTGFVSNTVVLRWMEDLRVSLMREQFPTFAHNHPENLSVICEAHVRYLKPITYDDSLIGEASICIEGPVRWRANFAIVFAACGSLAIKSHQIGSFINSVTHRPVRIPRSISETLIALNSDHLLETRPPFESAI